MEKHRAEKRKSSRCMLCTPANKTVSSLNHSANILKRLDCLADIQQIEEERKKHIKKSETELLQQQEDKGTAAELSLPFPVFCGTSCKLTGVKHTELPGSYAFSCKAPL